MAGGPASFHQQHIHRDRELLLARSHDHAVHRRDVGKIPPDRQNDVIVLDENVIGRVEADLAEPLTAPQ